jgi:ribosomal-protein-alanine N-acetyltransferase
MRFLKDRRISVTFDFVEDIVTPRLALIAITPDSVRSEQAKDGRLGEITAARVPAEWPPEHWEPHVFEILLQQFAEAAGNSAWNRYIALRDEGGGRTLIGTLGGFRSVERPAEFEIGYSVLPAFQMRGYASEAAQGFIAWVLTHSSIETITAQTFPELTASIRVLEKCGMKFDGPGYENGAVLYRLRR